MLICFGDSNTWGANPLGGRHAESQRWPTLLADQLNMSVKAEGQPGRTLQASRPEFGVIPDRARWQKALRQHPAIIILALGINDLAAGASAEEASGALALYLEDHQALSPQSQLLVIAPAPLGQLTANWRALFGGKEAESHKLVSLWQRCCAARGVAMLDITPLLSPLADGLHWSVDDHQRIADAVGQLINPHGV